MDAIRTHKGAETELCRQMDRAKCRHCKTRMAALQKRGLCHTCALDPDIRALYPSESKFGAWADRKPEPELETRRVAVAFTLNCHRCGRSVIVAEQVHAAFHLGDPVVVECERPCVPSRPIKPSADGEE